MGYDDRNPYIFGMIRSRLAMASESVKAPTIPVPKFYVTHKDYHSRRATGKSVGFEDGCAKSLSQNWLYFLRSFEIARLADLAERTKVLAVVFTRRWPAPTSFFALETSFLRAFLFGSFSVTLLATIDTVSAASLAVRTATPTVEPMDWATLSTAVVGFLRLMFPPGLCAKAAQCITASDQTCRCVFLTAIWAYDSNFA
jgi:hypothetical protein